MIKAVNKGFIFLGLLVLQVLSGIYTADNNANQQEEEEVANDDNNNEEEEEGITDDEESDPDFDSEDEEEEEQDEQPHGLVEDIIHYPMKNVARIRGRDGAITRQFGINVSYYDDEETRYDLCCLGNAEICEKLEDDNISILQEGGNTGALRLYEVKDTASSEWRTIAAFECPVRQGHLTFYIQVDAGPSYQIIFEE